MVRVRPRAATRAALLLVTGVVCASMGLRAQAPAAGDTRPSAGETAQAQPPKSQVPTLGRPTRPDDPAPVLDFGGYFTGTWHFEWDYPDSPLAPAGSFSGSTTFKTIDASTFEAISTGTVDDAAVTIREVIRYQRDERTIAREVTDSRGFAFKQTGTVAGDLGGQFTIRMESEPFQHKGQTIKVRSVQRLLSPLNFRTQTHVSVNGGPFENYGNPWWKKDVSR